MKANSEWISISDMMAGLMMVFMLISITFMLQTEYEKKAMADVALAYEKSKLDLNRALLEEFEDDLTRWGAEILPDTTFRFREPEVLFAVNSADIKAQFKTILDDFFPRYISILTRPEFYQDIEEIRIEGHTSSDWKGTQDRAVAYINNAELSQERSFSVLDYVFNMDESNAERAWLVRVLRANGLSFAKPIFDAEQREDQERSRRVEFRVITKTEERIYEILQKARS